MPSLAPCLAEEGSDDEEEDRLYDEVDEAEYMRIRQERMGNDDFIVDDEGDDYGYRYVALHAIVRPSPQRPCVRAGCAAVFVCIWTQVRVQDSTRRACGCGTGHGWHNDSLFVASSVLLI
jgi:hypothetical protein